MQSLLSFSKCSRVILLVLHICKKMECVYLDGAFFVNETSPTPSARSTFTLPNLLTREEVEGRYLVVLGFLAPDIGLVYGDLPPTCRYLESGREHRFGLCRMDCLRIAHLIVVPLFLQLLSEGVSFWFCSMSMVMRLSELFRVRREELHKSCKARKGDEPSSFKLQDDTRSRMRQALFGRVAESKHSGLAITSSWPWSVTPTRVSSWPR